MGGSVRRLLPVAAVAVRLVSSTAPVVATTPGSSGAGEATTITDVGSLSFVAGPGQVVRGESELPPGTTLAVTPEGGGGKTSQFVRASEAVVGTDGEFAASFDLSGIDVGSEVDVAVKLDGEAVAVARTSGTDCREGCATPTPESPTASLDAPEGTVTLDAGPGRVGDRRPEPNASTGVMPTAPHSTDAVTDPDLRLAVTTDAETFERLRDPLSARGIAVEHVRADERVLPLTDGAGAPAFPDVDVGWVYPSRLMEGAVVDTRLGVPWVNDRDVVLASRNKAGVLARLADAGVPVPETAMVSNPADEAEVLAAAERVGYPLVVKPNSTTRGVGIVAVPDPDSLLGVTDYLDLVHDYRATGDKSYLLQEFLPEARDYRVMTLDGAYAGAVERRLSEADRAAGRWKHNVHRGAVAEGVDLDPAARDVAERVAATLDAPLLGVDLLDADGRLVVSETNARPTVDAAEKYEPGFFDDVAALVRRTAAE